MNELLKVSSLTAGYGRRNVLRDLSFTLKEGEICAVLGENGAGKTTLLRAVGALLPIEGNCLLDGLSVREMNTRERANRIAYLSANAGTALPFSCLDAVLMGYYPVLGPLRQASDDQREHALDMLRLLRIGELAERDFAALSGGQKQLVLLARTLLRHTRLLLLDEPEAALDFNRRREILSLLRARARETGCGILLCCHDVNAALRFADRILTLKDGQIAADIETADADESALRHALSGIYGEIGLIRRGDSWLMAEEA